MKKNELLNQYVANLAVWNVKLHNLHWNVVGKRFVQIHEFTEEIYDDAFEKYDEVAELLKMKGEMPLSTLAEYLEVASLEEVTAKDFSPREVLEILKNDLELMKNLGLEIRNLADEEGDFETVAIFEDYAADYSKNLWFVNSMLKWHSESIYLLDAFFLHYESIYLTYYQAIGKAKICHPAYTKRISGWAGWTHIISSNLSIYQYLSYIIV